MLLGAPSGAPSGCVAGTASTARMGSIGLGLLRQIFTLAFKVQKMGCPRRAVISASCYFRTRTLKT